MIPTQLGAPVASSRCSRDQKTSRVARIGADYFVFIEENCHASCTGEHCINPRSFVKSGLSLFKGILDQLIANDVDLVAKPIDRFVWGFSLGGVPTERRQEAPIAGYALLLPDELEQNLWQIDFDKV